MGAILEEQLVLTQGQQDALTAFISFLSDPLEQVFVLQGYSGCGKSTLVRHILDRLPNLQRTIQLINPEAPRYSPLLTATTNKAAENLAYITGESVRTIHSLLGLRVIVDYETKVTNLVPKRNISPVLNSLIFIDEASFIDKQLLNAIFKYSNNCKYVFIGDPAQLAPVKSKSTPVFAAGFPGAALTEVVRQAEGNPIVELSTKFRHTVNTGEFFSFVPDGVNVIHVERNDFDQLVLEEFSRPEWKHLDSKVLAWTNKAVINYNKGIREHVKGEPHLEVGDYAVCNSYLQLGAIGIKTDQLVHISKYDGEVTRLGVTGKEYVLDNSLNVFQPNSREDKQKLIRQLEKDQKFSLIAEIENTWADLRAAYACTINKSQGSTYDKVFIDLDDIRRCNSGEQIARMLYVAVSRARHQVVLTGDIA